MFALFVLYKLWHKETDADEGSKVAGSILLFFAFIIELNVYASLIKGVSIAQ